MSFHYNNYQYARSASYSPLPEELPQANEPRLQIGMFDGKVVTQHAEKTVISPKPQYRHLHLFANNAPQEYSDSESDSEDSTSFAFTPRNISITHPYAEYAYDRNDRTILEFENQRMLDYTPDVEFTPISLRMTASQEHKIANKIEMTIYENEKAENQPKKRRTTDSITSTQPAISPDFGSFHLDSIFVQLSSETEAAWEKPNK